MPSKVWDEITYPFPDFNDGTVEVWELIGVRAWMNQILLCSITGKNFNFGAFFSYLKHMPLFMINLVHESNTIVSRAPILI